MNSKTKILIGILLIGTALIAGNLIWDFFTCKDVCCYENKICSRSPIFIFPNGFACHDVDIVSKCSKKCGAECENDANCFDGKVCDKASCKCVSKMEKPVTITIDKYEYESEKAADKYEYKSKEIIKLTIKNNQADPIWYRDDIYCYLKHQFEDGVWVPSININMMVCPRGVTKKLVSNKEILYIIDFSGDNHIFYLGEGRYRFAFKYGYSSENVDEKVIYSNEFTIKEKK